MKSDNDTRDSELKRLLLGLRGTALVFLVGFAGLMISLPILKIENMKTRVVILGIHIILQVIAMIASIIYTFRNERKLFQAGKLVTRTAGATLTLAIVIEGIFLMCNVGAWFDFISKLG